MGQTFVASRRMSNKISDELDVSEEETKGKTTKKVGIPRKWDMEYGSPWWGRLASYSVWQSEMEGGSFGGKIPQWIVKPEKKCSEKCLTCQNVSNSLFNNFDFKNHHLLKVSIQSNYKLFQLCTTTIIFRKVIEFGHLYKNKIYNVFLFYCIFFLSFCLFI